VIRAALIAALLLAPATADARKQRYIIKAHKRDPAPEPPLADIGPRVVKIERVVPWKLWCERIGGGVDC
jgi:hypothetical protein